MEEEKCPALDAKLAVRRSEVPPDAVTIRRVQYDGAGNWLDIELSSGSSFRLDTFWLVEHVLAAVHNRDEGIALLTAGSVLRWEDAGEI